MKKNALILLTVLMLSSGVAALYVNRATANFMVTLPLIVITSDGSITPETDLIEKNGNVYSLAANLSQNYAVLIQCSNTVFDGRGHFINGSVSYGGYANAGIALDNVCNVTVKNVHVSGFGMVDINLNASSCCSVIEANVGFIWVGGGTDNKVTNSSIGKLHLEDTEKNVITLNSITDTLLVENSTCNSITVNNIYQIFYRDNNDGNTFFGNNFWCGRGEPLSLHFFEYTGTTTWDNGSVGNYWFDYDGNDVDFNGIGDTPYFLKTKVYDESVDKVVEVVIAQDNYPLMTPYEIEHNTIALQQIIFLVVFVASSSIAIVGVGLFVHHRKRRRSPKI